MIASPPGGLTARFSADEMTEWVASIVGRGIRRPGTAADRWTEQWAADMLRSFGIPAVALEPVPVTSWQVAGHGLSVDGVELPHFPVPYSGAAAEGITAPIVRFDGHNDVSGAIAVVDVELTQLPQAWLATQATATFDPEGVFATHVQTLPFSTHMQLVMEPAIAAGAVGFIGALTGMPWETHDYFVPYDAVRRPIPGAWVSRRTAAALADALDAGPGIGSIRLDASTPVVDTHNVVATLEGTGDEWVIVASHHDGPWASAVEDAVGVALVLAQAEHWAAVPVEDRPHNMCFLLTSGHMAHAAGTRAFIDEHPEIVERTVVQLHLEHAARECRPEGDVLVPTDQPEPRWWFTSRIDVLEQVVLQVLAEQDLGRSHVLPPDVFGDMPATDGAFFHPAGVPLVHFLTAPMYLFDSCDTLDKVHEASLEPLSRAVVSILDASRQWDARSMRAAVRPRDGARTAHDDAWRSKGFYRLDGFAEPAVGQAMLDDVVSLTRSAAGSITAEGALILPEANLADGAGLPEALTSKVFRLHRRPVFASFLARPEVVSVLVERLGPDVDCFLSQFIFKNPGAWGQPWHQDSYYFPFDPPRPVVGLWLAVTEATLANGCLHVVPGSHGEPVHEHIPDRRQGANLGYVEIVDHDMGAAEPVLMAPGDLLVFDSHLMHRSTDNTSEGIRAAMVFHFAPAGTVDQTEAIQGAPSPVNDWVPVVRDGVALTGSDGES